MLGFLFGFNARLGRLQFFLATIAVAILMTAVAFAIAGYVVQHTPRGTMPSLTTWPVISIALLFGWLTFTLYAMRIRDIGCDPVCIIAGWFAVMIIDYLIATRFPALSLGPQNSWNGRRQSLQSRAHGCVAVLAEQPIRRSNTEFGWFVSYA